MKQMKIIKTLINYKIITNLPFINPEYIFDIYKKIKAESQANNNNDFLKFLDYYKTS